MAPLLALEPLHVADVAVMSACDVPCVGNDGLTDLERAEYAARYRAGAGSRRISAAEKAAIQAWLEHHSRAC